MYASALFARWQNPAMCPGLTVTNVDMATGARTSSFEIKTGIFAFGRH